MADTLKTTNVDVLQTDGSTETVGTPSVVVLRRDPDSKVLEARGANVPTDADAGYAKGCIFIKTDGGVATTTYINEGSSTSADFNAVESSASTVTSVTAGAGLTGGGTEGALTLAVGAGTGITVNADDVAITTAGVTRALQSAPAMRKPINVDSATIATTGDTDTYVIVPETGTLDSIDFSGVDALATSDTNYITFSITNLGQAGAGSTVMLAATNANTTKATGGTAIAANTKRSLTVTGTGADLAVTAGDRLRIRAAATGTLANTVTFPTYLLRFGGTS